MRLRQKGSSAHCNGCRPIKASSTNRRARRHHKDNSRTRSSCFDAASAARCSALSRRAEIRLHLRIGANWRRRTDSNRRCTFLRAYSLSRGAPSTTRPRLRKLKRRCAMRTAACGTTALTAWYQARQSRAWRELGQRAVLSQLVALNVDSYRLLVVNCRRSVPAQTPCAMPAPRVPCTYPRRCRRS